MWSDLFLLAPSLITFLILVGLRKRNEKPAAKTGGVPENAIVVDGSNVMHWGNAPSVPVLSRVLQDLVGKGYNPVVFFDASAGYRLADRYYDEAKLAEVTGIPQRQICVVHKGVVADEWILMFATDHGLRIVTNDQFRDWRVAFPHAAKKGVLVRGAWRQGSVIWRGKL